MNIDLEDPPVIVVGDLGFGLWRLLALWWFPR